VPIPLPQKETIYFTIATDVDAAVNESSQLNNTAAYGKCGSEH